jgi:hypothetical protein
MSVVENILVAPEDIRNVITAQRQKLQYYHSSRGATDVVVKILTLFCFVDLPF